MADSSEMHVIPNPPQPSGGNGGGGNYGDRISKIEARLDATVPFLATKEDIAKLKIWVLTSVVGGGIVTSLIILISLARLGIILAG